MGAGQPSKAVVWACLLHVCLAAASDIASEPLKHVEETCKPCHFAQGAASFGILHGGKVGPLKLRPLELLHIEAPAALPLANPVLTPLELTEQLTAGSSGGDSSSNTTGRLAAVDAISHPSLVSTPDGRLFLFFAAHACGRDHWGIAAAESPNGSGTRWRGLGMVLEEEGIDLHAPSIFYHDNNWFLVPETAGQQEVRVFKATQFPVSWQPAGVMLPQPLADLSVVQHKQQWWLLGTKKGPGQGKQGDELAVFQAQAPLGPWAEHPAGSLSAQGPMTARSLFTWNDSIYSPGRTCRGGTCGEFQVMQLSLAGDAPMQSPVHLDVSQRLWRQPAAWDSAGWTHLAIGRRPDGEWLAVVEASQLPPTTDVLSQQLQAAIAAFKALSQLSIAFLLLSSIARVPLVRSQLAKRQWGQPLLACLVGLCPGSRKLVKSEDPLLPAFLPLAPSALVQVINSDTAAATGVKPTPPSNTKHRSNGSAARRNGINAGGCDGGLRLARKFPMLYQQQRRRLPPCRLLLAAVVLVLAMLGNAATRRVQQVAKPFFVQPRAMPVDGQWSRFTLMVMSYDARRRELEWYVRHYSQCPSVGEILVVWNRGTPPDPLTDFHAAVPVRVRVEAINSMNNRFRPDPDMQFRSVLSLDDDILIPCTTIESTFALWRRNPQQLVGFYPRILLPQQNSSGPPVYAFEDEVFKQGAYNTILAGAAFMDSATFFPAYSSAELAPARALVDSLFNCDDLLLNFVVANWTLLAAMAAEQAPDAAAGLVAAGSVADAAANIAGTPGGQAGGKAVPPVQLVRPERRIDLSRLSSVGISHNPARFKAAADLCLAEFTRLFGGCPLQLRQIVANYGRPPNCRLWPLDCMYLS